MLSAKHGGSVAIKPNIERDELRDQVAHLRIQLSLMEERGATDSDIQSCRYELAAIAERLATIEGNRRA
jgi:hypothetical protein